MQPHPFWNATSLSFKGLEPQVPPPDQTNRSAQGPVVGSKGMGPGKRPFGVQLQSGVCLSGNERSKGVAARIVTIDNDTMALQEEEKHGNEDAVFVLSRTKTQACNSSSWHRLPLTHAASRGKPFGIDPSGVHFQDRDQLQQD